MTRRASETGLTLVEVSIILIATLSIVGALSPAISAVVLRAETTTAQTTLATISTAINTALIDMNYNFLTTDGAKNGPKVELLVGDGDIPAAVSATGSATWQQAVDLNLVDFLEHHMIQNQPGDTVGNAYAPGGANAWRGAYLNGPVDPDPWGNRYMVNTIYLGKPVNDDVVVLSAGPDEEIDSAFTALDFNLVTVDDDLFVIVEAD
jgi:Tfp pilus assembly protein PilE